MQFNQLNKVNIATEEVVCRVSQNTDFIGAGNERNVQPTDCTQCCQYWGWVALYSVVSNTRCACVTEKGAKMHVPKNFQMVGVRDQDKDNKDSCVEVGPIGTHGKKLDGTECYA